MSAAPCRLAATHAPSPVPTPFLDRRPEPHLDGVHKIVSDAYAILIRSGDRIT